jgi:small-conductance mechanosensitive channel
MSGRVLARFQEDFSRQHKEAMWFIHRWAFRAIFLIAFLILFSAEFGAFLPFIAIMATAIGFALRDVVYSFIGWFMIGASDGYQEGDIIQVEGYTGKVFRITPLLTTLAEHGIQGVTGKMVSFPNKIIFDKSIKNFSRSHGFTFISLDFLLTHTSDIDHARNILMEILGQQDLTLYYNSRSVLNKLRYTYGYNEDDLHPRIDVIVDAKGIILRAKVFSHVETMYTLQTKISEEFCKRIFSEPSVELQKG